MWFSVDEGASHVMAYQCTLSELLCATVSTPVGSTAKPRS
jgi:hypothetical protein